MARCAAAGIGPASSTGSPMTFMMRPSVPSPTGTAMGWPVSLTAWPRVRPSVESMAMARTVFSPRCCATSSTRRLPRLSVASAFRMAGRWPSNWTSTTGPRTCVMRPVAVLPFGIGCTICGPRGPFVPCWISERFGARDDLDEFLGDHGLARAVVEQRELADHLAGVARGVVHGGHAGALLAGGVFEQRAEDLHGDGARQELGQDLGLAWLVFVARR